MIPIGGAITVSNTRTKKNANTAKASRMPAAIVLRPRSTSHGIVTGLFLSPATATPITTQEQTTLTTVRAIKPSAIAGIRSDRPGSQWRRPV